jgi:hypothetical protein
MSGNNNSIPTSTPENVLPQQVLDESIDSSDNDEIMDTDTNSMAATESSHLTDGESSDAIDNLRYTLKNITQKLARGVAMNISSDELKALQDEATRIKNCILFLDEAQALCVTPVYLSSTNPTASSIFPSAPRSNHVIPSDLPVWQWRGNIWKKDADVQDSVEDLLDSFALIVESNGLVLDANWARLIPIKMNRDQRSWFNETLKGRNLSWLEVRKIIVKTYATQDVAQELDHMDQLLSLKMMPAESIEAFTDRFQRIRRAAKWDDDIRTATIFKRALPTFLKQEVSRSLLNVGRDHQDSVSKVAAKARVVLSSNICQNESVSSRPESSANAASNNHLSTGSNILSQGSDASRHNPKNAQRGMNLGVSKSSPPGATKNKFQCVIHGLANHPTEKCKRYKHLVANQAHSSGTTITPAATQHGSGAAQTSSGANICFRCTGNIPWSREHAAVCPRDKPHFRPARAIRSARLVSASSSPAPAPTRATTVTVDNNQLTGSNSMMDIDNNGFPVDYNCKSHKTFVNKTQKDVLNNTN